MNRFALIISVGSLAMLVACGAEPDSDIAANADATPKPAPVAKAPEDPAAKMARAVGDGKPGAAVDIRYEILEKPEVGKPTQIELAFIPSAGVDSLAATITGMEGVTIAGDLQVSFDSVQAGTPYEHVFSLLPDRTGVYYITVAATTTLGGSSIGRTFSIPFVVGKPEAQQQKAAPPTDASGQAIESMKGEEEGGND